MVSSVVVVVVNHLGQNMSPLFLVMWVQWELAWKKNFPYQHPPLERHLWRWPESCYSSQYSLARRTNVGLGLLSHVNTALAQLSENPCVTVQVKTTSSPGHAAALPSCSTLDTSTTSAVIKVSTGIDKECRDIVL